MSIIDPLRHLRERILGLVEEYAEVSCSTEPFVAGKTLIQPSGKVIGGSEIRMAVDACLDGWLTTGRFNDAFESRLSGFIGVRYAVTANSGSSANLLAVSALTSPLLGERRLQPGDEVITVAAGFPTTVNPIIQCGCVPVFVDVNIPTYNIDSDLIEAAVTEKTRAIVLAHTLGNPFDVNTVLRVARKYHLWMIEDCCDALGSTYALDDDVQPMSAAAERDLQKTESRRAMVGSFGHIGTLSFYPAHHITMGEGGALFTNDSTLRVIIKSFRDWGRDCYCEPGKDNTCKNRFRGQHGQLPVGYDHKYTYSHPGYNLKITDIQAAIGLAQMDRLEGFISTRKGNFTYLRQILGPLEKFLILPEATPGSDPSWFGFPVMIRNDIPFERVDLLRYLNGNKIGTRLLFGGNLVCQPYFKGVNYRESGKMTHTEAVMKRTFWLGVSPQLDQAQLDYVAYKMQEFFGKTDHAGGR